MSAGRMGMWLGTILWAVCTLHLSCAEAGQKAAAADELEFVPNRDYLAWVEFPVGTRVEYVRTWLGKMAKPERWSYLLHSVNEHRVEIRRLRYDLKKKQWVPTAGKKTYHKRINKDKLRPRTVLGTETVMIGGRPYKGTKVLERLGEHQDLVIVLSERVPGHIIKETLREISGGQQRRDPIARAITRVATIILADEPTSGIGKDAAKGQPVQQPGPGTRKDK